ISASTGSRAEVARRARRANDSFMLGTIASSPFHSTPIVEACQRRLKSFSTDAGMVMAATADRKNETHAGALPFGDARVKAKFESYPPATRRSVMAMRALL